MEREECRNAGAMLPEPQRVSDPGAKAVAGDNDYAGNEGQASLEGRNGMVTRNLIRKASDEERNRASAEITDLSHPSRSFYAMVAVSTTIAAYGLLSNSTAIVIGAMLVAPLMGPIFGVALSLSSGDRSLLRSSLTAEAAGVFISVLIALIIGSLPLRAGFGSEIIARTHPTIYDIIVAVASGIAGAYAMTNPRISPALPGVAISTSLVPPLATCGLCLSAGRFEDALGAFLLFTANFLAIELAAAAVFIVFGISIVSVPERGHLREYGRRFGPSIFALIGVSVFLTHTLVAAIESKRLSDAVQTELSSQLRTILGAQLSSFTLGDHGDGVGVVAVVLTPHEIEPDLVARLEDGLHKRVSPQVRLVVRSLISSDADKNGPVFLADEERERQTEVRQQTEFLSKASEVLRAELRVVPGARLVDLRRELNGGTAVTAVVRTPEAIGSEHVRSMETKLSSALGSGVHLVLRCVITKDVDSNGILYQKEPSPDDAKKQAFGKRLRQALQNQLSVVEPGCSLTQLRYGRINGELHVLAVVRTPTTLTPRNARRIEVLLRKYVEPSTVLVIRSVIGADVSPEGYVTSIDESRLQE